MQGPVETGCVRLAARLMSWLSSLPDIAKATPASPCELANTTPITEPVVPITGPPEFPGWSVADTRKTSKAAACWP